jgi:SAM-dependent methyltransferase
MTAATRASHAQRVADTQAAFFLPHLRPGMALLDLGCGPGSITVGLAAAVAPGPTTGIDLQPARPDGADGITLIHGDVLDLPFPAASFDAIFASALLQHLGDPARALREARRVARSGAVIGVVDADWDGEVRHPTDAVLDRSIEVLRRTRAGTSPYVGRRLRALLGEAGFVDCVGSARAVHYGTPEEVAGVAAGYVRILALPAVVEAVTTAGWASAEELARMAAAWREWGTDPGAFVGRLWCEAVGTVA